MGAERTPLEAAEKKISDAWWLALICAGATALLASISLGGEPIAGIDAWAFADVALLIGLAFGLARKSRTCAVLLLVYFVGSKLLLWHESGNLKGLPVALLLTFYFGRGVLGAFDYHRLVDAEPVGARSGLYRPAGGSRDQPWLVWTILASLVLVGTGGAWYFSATRALREASAAPNPIEVESAIAAAVGRLGRVEMNGSVSPLSAAIAVDDGMMLVPCRGITEGAPLLVKLDAHDLQAKVEEFDAKAGVCKLAIKDRGSWPLRVAPTIPKVGDAVFAASFDPAGKVVVSRGELRKVSNGARGTVFESSARNGTPVEGTPLLDARGRVFAIALEGEDTTLPEAWTAHWPAR